MADLSNSGFALTDSGLSDEALRELRDHAFIPGAPGKRCLLDLPAVRMAAVALRGHLAGRGLMPADSPAVQAIAFDKTAGTNWKVAWHQDLMFPFSSPPAAPGYELHSRKDGVDYARPPREVLESLLAVRLHLDPCGVANGPLRVAPGSHRSGVLKTADLPDCVARHGEHLCFAEAGELLLMRPLLLHASSQASAPRHRRVLHFVYHCGSPIEGVWFRRI